MPRTREDNQAIQAHRREAILAAGLTVFSEKGLAATKIGDIAAEAGMSQGLLYHYFSAKEEVYTAIIANAYGKMAQAARGLESAPGRAEKKIRRALAELLNSLASNESFARSVMLIAQARSSSAVPDEVKRMGEDLGGIPYRVMEGIFRKGQEEGSVPEGNPEDLALLFWVIVKGLGMHRASLGSAYDSPDSALLLRMFLK